MPRRISSVYTFPTKFITPVVVPAVFLGLFFWDVATFGYDSGMTGFLVVFLVGYAFAIFFFSVPLKRVAIDADNLYVSNYFREITVPIADVDRVTEFLLTEPRRVTIHLKNPCEFGPKIVFLATYRPFAFLSSHPIVDELQSLALRKFMSN